MHRTRSCSPCAHPGAACGWGLVGRCAFQRAAKSCRNLFPQQKSRQVSCGCESDGQEASRLLTANIGFVFFLSYFHFILSRMRFMEQPCCWFVVMWLLLWLLAVSVCRVFECYGRAIEENTSTCGALKYTRSIITLKQLSILAWLPLPGCSAESCSFLMDSLCCQD